MRVGLLILLFFLSTKSFASIHKNILSEKKQVLMSLKLPLETRILNLKKLKISYKVLQSLSLDEKQPLHIRWRATIALGMIFKKKSISSLLKAVNSKKWFMRNSGLIALYHANPRKALTWAEKLIEDPALVVRTAAVETIKKLNASNKKILLWKKLYSKENYNRKKGLWVRKTIVETLVQFAEPGDEKHFIKLLSDSDKSLHKFAVHALEKITSSKIGSEKTLGSKKVDMWRAWWASRHL